MYMAQKAKKKSKLRHAEYYDMQKTFDSLYADSKRGEVFGHLMDIISAPSNIKLAFRNIKGNDGSHTAGTDGRTIESLAVMPEDKFVKLIQKQFRRYEPKAVKRVEIPKPNGKMRPLGIPCIIDRIVQQCILQVMEPICEAKFYEHSYGFRPCRSAENAISYAYQAHAGTLRLVKSCASDHAAGSLICDAKYQLTAAIVRQSTAALRRLSEVKPIFGFLELDVFALFGFQKLLYSF